MARLRRLALAQWPQMVVQRVHQGQVLVHDEPDVAQFRAVLCEVSREHKVAVHAYAIATDHFYLLVTPEAAESLSAMVQSLGRRYVAAFNARHGRRGGLWAGRYRSTVLEPQTHLLEGMVFIETRPGGERASSAAHHLGLRVDPIVQDPPLFWALGNTPFDRQAAWRHRLEQGLGSARQAALNAAADAGWAMGSDEFIAHVEALTGRRLRPLARGRPKKHQTISST